MIELKVFCLFEFNFKYSDNPNRLYGKSKGLLLYIYKININ